MRHDKGYVLNTRATFHERLRVLFIPDNHIKGSRENGCIYLIFFFFDCEQSLIFLYKVTQARKPRAAINEGVTS